MRHAAALFPVFGFVVCSLSATLSAQPAAAPTGTGRGTGTPPPPPANLQVLARDLARPELLTVMRGFTTGLGVTCDFCHAQGQDGRNDFASDDLPSKRVARAMMLMVGQVNQAVATALTAKPASEIVRVECATCHRGQAIPRS